MYRENDDRKVKMPAVASSQLQMGGGGGSGGQQVLPPGQIAPTEPGIAETIGTQYALNKSEGFIDDTVTPWLQDAGTNIMAHAKDAFGMDVAGAAPGAITSGVATGTEAAMAAELGTGIASGATGAAATGAAGAGAAAAGGGAMAGLMAAAPYAAAAYGLYRLLK